jgi:hypothetical protein
MWLYSGPLLSKTQPKISFSKFKYLFASMRIEPMKHMLGMERSDATT